MRNEVQHVTAGKRKIKDHREAANPYESKYGEHWEAEMNERDPVLKKVVCVTVLIDHIMRETSTAHADTDRATDWMFYHDALNQMTDKETRVWMKQQTLQGKIIGRG